MFLHASVLATAPDAAWLEKAASTSSSAAVAAVTLATVTPLRDVQ